MPKIALLGAAGCKKNDNAGKADKVAAKAATPAAAGAASPAAAGPDVTALNAAIPAAWKGKVEFAPRQLGERDDVMTVIVPKDWSLAHPRARSPMDHAWRCSSATRTTWSRARGRWVHVRSSRRPLL